MTNPAYEATNSDVEKLIAGCVIKSIHTGNSFTVEYVSRDGHCFVLEPIGVEKSRVYDMHDFKRSFELVSAPNSMMQLSTASAGDWAIDHSAGRPILVCRGCSVIEAEDADYVLSLIRAERRVSELESQPLCVKSNDAMREAAPLCVKLPDSGGKAFWSGTGKTEKFHPETYKRWVKEAIERAGDIAGIQVEVK